VGRSLVNSHFIRGPLRTHVAQEGSRDGR
jgi:hypothetical protein